jgi:hypothetical protein
MTLGNDKNMLWGLRMNISEGDNVLIPVDDTTRYLASRNLAK